MFLLKLVVTTAIPIKRIEAFNTQQITQTEYDDQNLKQCAKVEAEVRAAIAVIAASNDVVITVDC